MTNKVLARLTVTREDDSKVFVEVHADATFIEFYRFYTQQGRRRSTKKQIRSASRNEGLHPVNCHRQQPGLEILAIRFMRNRFGNSPIKTVKIKYFSKRGYKKLINAAPDQLGLTKVRTLFDQKPIKALIPIGPVSFKKVEKRNHLAIHAGASR